MVLSKLVQLRRIVFPLASFLLRGLGRLHLRQPASLRSPRRFRHSRSTRASSKAWARRSEGSVVLPSVISSGRALPPPNCAISCKRAFSASVEEPFTLGGLYAALRMDMSSRISSIAAVLRFRATKSMGL